MRVLKPTILACCVFTALLVFAPMALATTVTTTTGGAAATPTIHAVNEGGEITIANPIANISCSSTFEGKVESHGAGVTAGGIFASWLFTGCTNSWHATTIKGGGFFLHWSSGHNASWTLTTWRWVFTRFGVSCTYEANNTHFGTMTGGNPATLQVEASIPIVTGESSALCGTANAKMEGSYVTTSALYAAS